MGSIPERVIILPETLGAALISTSDKGQYAVDLGVIIERCKLEKQVIPELAQFLHLAVEAKFKQVQSVPLIILDRACRLCIIHRKLCY